MDINSLEHTMWNVSITSYVAFPPQILTSSRGPRDTGGRDVVIGSAATGANPSSAATSEQILLHSKATLGRSLATDRIQQSKFNRCVLFYVMNPFAASYIIRPNYL